MKGVREGGKGGGRERGRAGGRENERARLKRFYIFVYLVA